MTTTDAPTTDPVGPWRGVAIAACVIAAAALAVAAVAVTVNWQRTNDIIATRTESRIAACISYNNEVVKNINALNDRTQGLMRAAFAPNPGRSAATQMRVDQFVEDQSLQFNAIKLQLHDCSPAGIVAFYARQGRP